MLEENTVNNNGNVDSKASMRRFVEKTKVFYPVLIAIVMLLIFGEIMSPGFLGSFNSILMTASFLAIVAVGQSLVIIVGGFGLDLSIGSVITLGALVTGMVCNGSNIKLLLVIPILIGAGIIIGCINGIGVQKLKIPPLAMTLIMSNVIFGFSIMITRAQPTINVPSILMTMGKPLVGPIRTLTVIAVVFVVAFELILRKTRYGQMVFLSGSNRNAAKLAGIKVDLVAISAYVFSSVIAALAGIILFGYAGSASMDMGDEYTMMTLAAVVIGGTKMSGGKGSLIGAFLGAIMIQLLSSVLVSVGMLASMRIFFEGLILLIIIIMDCRQPKLRQ